MTGSDNRRLKRFGLEIPVQIHRYDPLKTDRNTYLLSRDLSGNGAFVFTTKPLPVNAFVKLEMILNIRSKSESEHKQYSLIEVAGTVKRADSTGMAICFGSEFKISSIEGAGSP